MAIQLAEDIYLTQPELLTELLTDTSASLMQNENKAVQTACAYPFLLVEDDDVDILNAKRAFTKHQIKHQLYLARNGVEALHRLQGSYGQPKLDPMPKIILLDIRMPKMSGLELLETLQADPSLKNITVFITSISDQHCDKVAAYNLNVAGYLIKPIRYERFFNALQLIHPIK